METLQRTANRGSISTGGYEIDNSCVFVDTDRSSTGNGANSHLHFTPSSTGNRKVGTFSAWVKRSHIDSLDAIFSSGQNDQHFRFQTNGINIRDYNESTQLQTNAIYRDTAAFYHFVMAVDTTQGTAANRLKLYVNGDQVTSFSTETYPTQNQDWNFNYTGNKMFIGARRWYNDDVIQGLDGYMADVYWIDGQQLAATDFGEYDDDSGIWKPKAYSGTFGTNGCYLKFDNASDLGEDSSGNGNDWTKVNIAAANQSTDTPTNSFCTLNPLVNFKYTTNGITEGATEFGDDTGGGVGGAFGTMAVTKGKWYWEVKLTQQNSHYIGISAVDDGDNVTSSSDPHQINSSFRFNILGARIEYIDNGTNTNGSLDAFGDFHAVGDIIGIALNMDDNQISIYGNGVLQTGVANTSIYDAADKMVVPLHATINDECQYNFGGYSAWTPSSAASDENGYGTFEYAPPSGYYALCTKNLAEYG
jgi:hypothetical protein